MSESGWQHHTQLTAHLLELEKTLMDPAFRRDRDAVSILLSEGFREFGSSGREWSREAILDLLAAETDFTAPEVRDFAICPISPDAALVTYRTERPEACSLRSSLWIQESGRWRILFHQGTRCAQV